MEAAEAAVISSHITFTLQYMNLDACLVIGGSCEDLALSGWDSGISWNHLGKNATQSFDTKS